MVDEADLPKAEEAVRKIFAAMLRLGGSITGEHGSVVKGTISAHGAVPDTIAAMKRIKRSLDPNNIMNPGKIFLNARIARGVRHGH